MGRLIYPHGACPWVALVAAAACTRALPPCTSAELDAPEKHRAEQLTSLFENGTPELQYGYAEALGDGRGITAGRAGFTTATGDLLEVVERYVADEPQSPLAAYLPRLREVAAAESDSTSGLEGLEAAWGEAAADARFRAGQDEVVDELYYWPAMDLADEAHVCEPLSLAFVYDTIIQHGDGDDPDGLPALLDTAAERAGGTPATGLSESQWLPELIAVRRADLAHAADPDTREVWAGSVGRCDVFSDLVREGDWSLEGPLYIAAYDVELE